MQTGFMVVYEKLMLIIAGALLCALLWNPLDSIPAMWLGAAVLIIRILAMTFRWNLPRLKME